MRVRKNHHDNIIVNLGISFMRYSLATVMKTVKHNIIIIHCWYSCHLNDAGTKYYATKAVKVVI